MAPWNLLPEAENVSLSGYQIIGTPPSSRLGEVWGHEKENQFLMSDSAEILIYCFHLIPYPICPHHKC
jgi:hypothetical protein